MALNEKTKNTYRRVIRVLMVVIAALLLLIGLGVPIANNAIAMNIARNMEAMTLPPQTELVESTSLAGRLTNSRGSVQYFGALLIDSDLPLDELQAFYRQEDDGLFTRYTVAKQSGQAITVLGDTQHAFRTSIESEGQYIVYTVRTGGNIMQWWLDMDTRG